MSKKVLKSTKVINAGSMASSLTSGVTPIEFLDNIGIQLNFTGTPTGAFDVQISMDYDPQTGSGNFISLTFSTAPVAAGSANQIYIDLNQMSAPWLRIVYARTSGTGTLDAFVNGKEI